MRVAIFQEILMISISKMDENYILKITTESPSAQCVKPYNIDLKKYIMNMIYLKEIITGHRRTNLWYDCND